jgi:hypothetical protein
VFPPLLNLSQFADENAVRKYGGAPGGPRCDRRNAAAPYACSPASQPATIRRARTTGSRGSARSASARSPLRPRASAHRHLTRNALAAGLRIGGRFDCRKAHQRKGPACRAFQRTQILSDGRSSSGDRQQLPVLRHDDCIDGMEDAIRRSDIGLLDVRTIDMHARGRYGRGQRSTLNGHHVP